MSKDSTNFSSSNSRVTRAVEFIQKNLDKKMSVAQLSRQAHLSKYHFHRQFSRSTGVGVMKLAQLLRLKRASFRLVFDKRPSVIAIAMDAGFVNPESFARAFRSTFGQSPTEFMRRPAWRAWRAQYQFLRRIGVLVTTVEIVQFDETKVAALEHRGPHENVYDTTRRFIEWRRVNGVSPTSSRTYGIHYNDHRIVEPQNYRLDICASISADVGPNPHGVVTKVLPAGLCARVRHLGSREYIESADYLCNHWLPTSGYLLRDFPVFFHYVNVGPNIADHEMITDVYLPLKEHAS